MSADGQIASGTPKEISSCDGELHLSNYFSTDVTGEDPFDTAFNDNVSTPKESKDNTNIPDQQPQLVPTELPASTLPTVAVAAAAVPQLDLATVHRLQQQDAWLPLGVDPDHRAAASTEDIRPIISSGDCDEETTELDPYRSTLIQYLGDDLVVDSLRRVPVVPEVVGQQAIESQLKNLITNGWYRIALQVTYRILRNDGFTQERDDRGGILTSFTAQVWLTRLALLVRIRKFETAELELSTFRSLDAFCFFYESRPDLYPNRKGSMIPFSLRLLHAELPFRLGQIHEALDRLYSMLHIIRRIQSNLRNGLNEEGSNAVPDIGHQRASLSLWICREVRVLSSCLSIYLSEFDYQAAIETVHRLAMVCSYNQSVVRGLAGILGRIYLQMGDLETAKVYFSRAVHTTEHQKQPELAVQKIFQEAVLAIGRNEYEEAKKLFQQVLQIDPTNVSAANNLAVCCLYLGQLSSAIRVLDVLTTSGLSDRPPQQQHSLDELQQQTGVPSRRRFCLHDALVFNLAVLYEVESDAATSKKLRLLERLASLSGEPIHLTSLKLPQPVAQ